MTTTSEPAPGSDIASAPTCSPEISLGRYLALLRLGAVAADLVDAEIGMRAVGQADRAEAREISSIATTVLEIAEPGAAVFLLDRDAVQAERAQLRPQVARECVAAVDLGGARRDLGRRRSARDGVAHHVGGFAEVEIEAGIAAHRSVSRPCASG